MTKKNNVAISHLIRSFFAFAMLLACLYPLTAQRITYKRERELQNRLQCANLSLLQKDKPMAMHIYKEVRDNGQYSPIALIANDSLMRNGYYEKDIETVWECLKYLEKYPEHFPAIENIPARIQDYRNRYSVLIDNITVHDDLCGIWVSDYTEDTHKAPYLILKIERVDDNNYVAHMLPTCQTTWKFPTYFHTGKIAPTYVFPREYKFSDNSEFPVAPFGGNFDTKSFYAHFADKNYQKAHPEEAVMLAETGARVIDMARSLFKETTSDPDFFRESASFKTEVYGTTLALAGVGVAIGVLSAVLKNSKVRGYSVEFQGKYTVRGEMECILKEEASEINTFTGKEDDKSKQIKMRMLKIYPDYDIRFIGYNNSLVGSHSFSHKEAKASPEHKYRGEKILQYNTQSYNRLFESFVKSHEYSPDSVKTYISNHYNEFNVSNRGVSFGMVPTDYGHYYGELKGGKPLDYEELKDGALNKKPKHLIKKENCLFVGYLKNNKREGQGTNYQFGDSTEVIMSTTGTWKDGKLSGQATQDDYIHHLHFEGEYSDGYRQGKGILTDTVNNIIYEGNWNTRHRKECLNGDVVEKNLDGEILFSGKYKDNHREGGGTEHYWDGSTYRGIWKNGLKHGYGVLQIPDINATYSQIWRKGILKKGIDIERNESGEIVFNGEYKNDQRDGYGTEYQEDGNVFKGYWKKGAKHGKGVFYDMNKSYDQTWRYGILKRGRAVERNEKGEIIYEGSYRNDKRNGYGTEYYGNGCVYNGHWKSGVKHGNGTLYIPDTNESYKEEWKKGVIIKCNQ